MILEKVNPITIEVNTAIIISAILFQPSTMVNRKQIIITANKNVIIQKTIELFVLETACFGILKKYQMTITSPITEVLYCTHS
nr:hypothetical protein [uncultured Flavobacterium sp.]